MNATIEKIVNLLFEDLVENDEIRAIHEEILQNCQERYQDLREAGVSEDDAIHAVIESLNGMEEMLSAYPRKADESIYANAIPEPHKVENADVLPRWSCDPCNSPIQEIRMEHMAGADVYVSVSQDAQLHVECSNPELTLMTSMDNGVLTIALSDQSSEEMKEEIQFSMQEGFDLSSLGKMFEKLAKRFVSIKSSLKGTDIMLEIPDSIHPVLKISTTDGDVSVEPIQLEHLRIGNAGGDINVDAATIQQELRVTSASGNITITGSQAHRMQLCSASGDIEVSDCLVQENVKINTTSGDITWCKQCKALEATTVSGDISLEGAAETLTFRTVSGDVELTLNSAQLHSLTGSTTSGDMDISLPDDLQVDLQLNAVSSHISSHANCVPGAPVVVKLSTVSGDIEVN